MEDKVESIPATMEKYLGCKGKMVKPSPETVKMIVKKVRKGKLITLLQLREKLAIDFSVQTACPAATAKSLQLLAQEEKPVCYWRVITAKGELIGKYPGGLDSHAALLESEGAEVDLSKKKPVVANYESKLMPIT